MKMKVVTTVASGEFKTKCLSLLDEVQSTRKSIVITKRGRPVARLVPIDEEIEEPLFGRMRGTISIRGDITEPVDESWKAGA
jgi:prevent-host-death family protein